MEKILRDSIGKKIEISVIHNVEGISRITMGILKRVTDNLIIMECSSYRIYRLLPFYKKEKKYVYVLNRKSCSLLSLVIWDEEYEEIT